MVFKKVHAPYLLGLVLGLLVSQTPELWAAPSQLEQSQAQLSYIKKELAQNRLVLKDLRSKRISLLEAMGRLDESLAKLETEKRKTTEIESELKVALERLETAQASGEERLTQLKQRVEDRLKGIYVMGQGRTARVLLDAKVIRSWLCVRLCSKSLLKVT